MLTTGQGIVDGKPMDLAELRRRLDRELLTKVLERRASEMNPVHAKARVTCREARAVADVGVQAQQMQ